jgi:hypothetical protein
VCACVCVCVSHPFKLDTLFCRHNVSGRLWTVRTILSLRLDAGPFGFSLKEERFFALTRVEKKEKRVIDIKADATNTYRSRFALIVNSLLLWLPKAWHLNPKSGLCCTFASVSLYIWRFQSCHLFHHSNKHVLYLCIYHVFITWRWLLFGLLY